MRDDLRAARLTVCTILCLCNSIGVFTVVSPMVDLRGCWDILAVLPRDAFYYRISAWWGEVLDARVTVTVFYEQAIV